MDVTTYKVLDPVAMRARYAALTDRLIYVMEGHDGWVPDYLLCLDKSARPVGWLVRSLWPLLAREAGTEFTDGHVPPRPQMRFVNIDREQWWDLTGASEVESIDVNRVPDEAIASLRSVFARDLSRDVWEQPSWLDGQRVLVVDEVRFSGDTLTIAMALIQRAFPFTDVRGEHWMATTSGTERRSGLRKQVEIPVWYREDTWTGRLVGQRMHAGVSPLTPRNRMGALFLSSRPPEPDTRGLQLRQEISQLAAEVASGKLLFAPSGRRSVADYLERVNSLFGYSDLGEFRGAREAQDAGLDG